MCECEYCAIDGGAGAMGYALSACTFVGIGMDMGNIMALEFVPCMTAVAALFTGATSLMIGITLPCMMSSIVFLAANCWEILPPEML